MDVTAKMKNKNGDSKIQPKGPDGTAGNSDDEVWCENSGGQPIKCRFFPKGRFRSVCEEAGGSYTQQSDGADICTHSSEGIVAIARDDDSDGYYDLSEYWCETLNESAEPSGNATACPFDEWTD